MALWGIHLYPPPPPQPVYHTSVEIQPRTDRETHWRQYYKYVSHNSKIGKWWSHLDGTGKTRLWEAVWISKIPKKLVAVDFFFEKTLTLLWLVQNNTAFWSKVFDSVEPLLFFLLYQMCLTCPWPSRNLFVCLLRIMVSKERNWKKNNYIYKGVQVP